MDYTFLYVTTGAFAGFACLTGGWFIAALVAALI